jgi:hypothetical protein
MGHMMHAVGAIKAIGVSKRVDCAMTSTATRKAL